MDDQLHAAAFVEESLSDKSPAIGHDPERGPAAGDIFNRLLRAGPVEPALFAQPVGRGWRRLGCGRGTRMGFEPPCNLASQVGHVEGKFARARRSFSAPERNVRWGFARILDEDAAFFDTPDLPGAIAQEKNVSAKAFHGEILVNSADRGAFRLRDDRVKGGFGNCAGVGERHKARPSAAAQAGIHAIPVQPRATPAAPRGNPFGKHRDSFFEIRPGKIAVGIGAPHQSKQIVLAPLLGRARRDDLLGHDVERRPGNLDGIQIARPDCTYQRGAFQKVIPRHRHEPPFRYGSAPMAGAANALQRDGNRARRADLANQIDGADVDAQLKGSRGDQRPQFAGLQAAFGFAAQFARQAAVMRGDGVVAHSVGQMESDALGQAPGVHENQGRSVSTGQFGDPVVGLVPDLVRGNWAEFASRNFHAKVHRAPAADFHNHRRGPAGAGEEPAQALDRLLRGGKADPGNRAPCECLQAFERKRKVRAALVVGNGMNLVDDDGLCGAKHLPASLGGQQDVERFGRRH